MGAAVRAMQIAGAMEAILDMSVGYANERVAFGRPIGKFQAVQHNLARLAGEAAAALAAAGSAADAISNGAAEEAMFLEAASAKIRAGEAAGEGAAIAHQVLGAIGFTRGAHAASLHAAAVGLARRLRQREPVGGEARQSRRGERRGRAVADAGGAVRRQR